MNSQFKTKPDKFKYLANVDTLDSRHKKITNNINKKRDDIEKQTQKLIKLKNELELMDTTKNNCADISNFIETRAKLIENIETIEEDIEQINNYHEETEYYSKTYQILFNYYDMLDGQIENEIKNNDYNTNNNYNTNEQHNTNIVNQSNDAIIDVSHSENVIDNNISTKNDVDEWNLEGIELFNSTKTNTLNVLYELKKKNRKEKKNTRKRVKNVESLIKDNNYDIFELINSNVNNSDVSNTNNQIIQNNNQVVQNNNVNKEYNIYDRAILYDDYKVILDGYNSKKKYQNL